jgi:hypothetical protein
MGHYKGTITEPDQIENLLRMCDNYTMWEVLRDPDRMGEPWVTEKYAESR